MEGLGDAFRISSGKDSKCGTNYLSGIDSFYTNGQDREMSALSGLEMGHLV